MSAEIERKEFKPGQVVFAEGDEADAAYLVESGMVEVAKRQGEAEMILTSLGPGEMVGEMALVDREPRSATVRAMKKTTLIVVPRRVFDRLVKESDPIINAVLSTVLRRLRHENAKNAKRVL